jgi:hypothetical protein
MEGLTREEKETVAAALPMAGWCWCKNQLQLLLSAVAVFLTAVRDAICPEIEVCKI